MARYALAIGVANYNKFQKLPKAVTDAQGIAQILREFGRFDVQPLPGKLIESENCWQVAQEKKLVGKELGLALRTFLLNLLPVQPTEGLVLAIKTMGENLEKLPKQIFSPVQDSLHRAMEIAREENFLHGHEDYVYSVAISPDGQYIVSGSRDKTLRLWDIQGNLIGQPFQGHENAVMSVAFSPDGQYIVTGSDDNTVWLWDTKGNPIGQPFKGHQGAVWSVAFSPDGKIIASSSADKTVRLWRGSWRAWLKVCCNRLRYHPVFKNPQTEDEKAACEVYKKYVWGEEE